MIAPHRQEELDMLLHGLDGEERDYLKRGLARSEDAPPRCDVGRLDDEELRAAEAWFWRRYAEAGDARARRAHARLWCIFVLLRYGGLRLVEALSLEARHVDGEATALHIEGEHARRIPFPAAPYRLMRRIFDDPSLLAPGGSLLRCDASHVRRSLRHCETACGLPGGVLTVRNLRRTRLQELLRQGTPPSIVDMFAGRGRRRQAGELRCDGESAYELLCTYVRRGGSPRTSARNVFHGRIEEVRAVGIMVRVVLRTPGGLRVTAMITDESCSNLHLVRGMRATAIVKAPWIIVDADRGGGRSHAVTQNCFRGTVAHVREDATLAEIVISLPDGNQACALHLRGENAVPPVGSAVWVIFKALSVILTLE